MVNLIYTELQKFKRSVMIWLMLLGGFLPAGTALLLAFGENPVVTWNVLFTNALNCMNQLALILFAVLTGYIFAGEYQERTVITLFTYPVSRFGFFTSKMIVAFLVNFIVYLILCFSTLLLGFIYIKSVPAAELWVQFIKFTVLMALFNSALVPLTSLISMIGKGLVAPVITGMCYVITYVVFIGSKLNVYIPSCIPTVVVMKYFQTGNFGLNGCGDIVITAVITFVAAVIPGALYYSRSDVY